MNQQQKQTEVKTVQPDLLDRIIEETRDVGISVTDHGLDFSTFTGLCTLSKLIFESGACPKSMDSSKKVLIAIAQGRTVGLDPFQSMQAFYIVNGQATLWGNAPLAICRQHPAWVEAGFDEWFEQGTSQLVRLVGHPSKWDDDTITAVCQTQRVGAEAKQSRFSVADAKKAGLWGATGKLYGAYPFRMLKFRARGYALNDNFGDSLKGIQIRETFDEEVDGKRNEVSNADELRDMLEKKQRKVTLAPVVETKAASSAPDAGPVLKFDPPNFEKLKPGDKVSFDGAISSPMSELEISRDWLKKVYAQIPMKANPIEFLKQASMNGYKWLAFEDIDNCEKVGWLNETAAKLEDMLATVKAAKA